MFALINPNSKFKYIGLRVPKYLVFYSPPTLSFPLRKHLILTPISSEAEYFFRR